MNDSRISPAWDEDWIAGHRRHAREGLLKTGKRGFMEAMFALSPEEKIQKNQRELLNAVTQAQILTFGWPIGVVLPNKEDRPRPTVDGIFAEIATQLAIMGDSYDYWAFRRNGDYYLLNMLFEDKKEGSTPDQQVFFNTRIVRTTEALQFAARTYRNLGVPASATVHIRISHGGLRGRKLGAVGNRLMMRAPQLPAQDDEVETAIRSELQAIDTNLVGLVKQLTGDLFMLFDFFELSDSVYSEIVTNFVAGRVT